MIRVYTQPDVLCGLQRLFTGVCLCFGIYRNRFQYFSGWCYPSPINAIADAEFCTTVPSISLPPLHAASPSADFRAVVERVSICSMPVCRSLQLFQQLIWAELQPGASRTGNSETYYGARLDLENSYQPAGVSSFRRVRGRNHNCTRGFNSAG